MANTTIVDNIILGCLTIKPMTGYEIKQLINNSTALFYNASYGSIYPTLKKQEDNGLIVSHELVENGRYKKIYDLTEAGHTVFMEWMMEAPKPIAIKYEMLVRVFFFQNLKKEEMVKQIVAYIEQLRIFQDQLKDIEGVAQEKVEPFQLMTLQWGEDFYTFLIQWYEKLLLQLQENELS